MSHLYTLTVLMIALFPAQVLVAKNLVPGDVDAFVPSVTRFEAGKKVKEGKMPAPWSAGVWDSSTTAELRVGKFDATGNRQAIGIVNLAGKPSLMLRWWKSVKLKPEQRYRIQFDYLTTGSAKGTFKIKFTSHKGGALTSTKGQWQTKTYDLSVGDNKARVACEWHNYARGDANVIYVRNISVMAVGEAQRVSVTRPDREVAFNSASWDSATGWYKQLAAELEAKGLPKGEFLFGNSEASAFKAFRKYGHQHDRAVLRKVDAPADQPFKQAIEIENVRSTAQYWSVVYGANPPVNAKPGDVMLMVLYVRSAGSREANIAQMRCAVKGKVKGTFSKVRGIVPPRPEWTRYYVPVQFNKKGPAGEWKIEIFIGGPTQVLQFGGLAVIWYGDRVKLADLPVTKVDYNYPGRSKSYDDDIPWLNAARDRIAKHRMQDIVIKIVDARGKSLRRGAKVNIDMTRHAFLFGSAGDTPRFDPKAKNWTPKNVEKFNQTFLELFNTITIGTYKWGPWRGRWSRSHGKEFTLKATQWAYDNNLYIHGHTPIWHQYGVMPFKRNETSPEEMRTGIFKWLNELYAIPQVAEQVDSWDAINHPFGFSSVWRDYGKALNLPDDGLELHVEELQLIRKLLPTKKLFVNEGRVLTRGGGAFDIYRDYVKYLIDKDAPLDGAGAMCHFGAASLTAPEELKRRIDAIIAPALEAGRPFSFRVTEFDISINRKDPEQVAIQTDYMRDFYTLMFSHPHVDGIIAWGFWEGRMWKPSAAWFTRNWQPLGMADEYRKLVLGRWWTKLQGTSDASGTFRGRGYKGDHRATVTLPDGTKQTIDFTLGDQPAVVTMRAN